MAKLQGAPNPYDFADDTPENSGPGDTSVSLRTRPHTGRDYPMPEGAPVRSQYDGTVLSASNAGDFGFTIVVIHPSTGTQTQYSHLGDMLVEPGSVVKRGDVIGKVGSTGKSTGPHLHYEENPLGAPIGFSGGQKPPDDKHPKDPPKPPTKGPSGNKEFDKQIASADRLLYQVSGGKRGALGASSAVFEPGDIDLEFRDLITKRALEAGMNPLFLSSNLWKKKLNAMSSMAFMESMAQGGEGNKLDLVERLPQLMSQGPDAVMARLKSQMVPLGSDPLGPAWEAKDTRERVGSGMMGPTGALTDPERARAMEMGSQGGTMLQALLSSRPDLIQNLLPALTYGNMGREMLLPNYVENSLLPRFGAYQPEYTQQGETSLNLLMRLLSGGS